MMDEGIIRRVVCRNYNNTVYSYILLDNYWQWFTMQGPMNIKFLFHMLIS